jgi:hypothetical protein
MVARGHIDRFFQRDLGALQQLHQRQQTLPVLGQPVRQRASVPSADYLIALLRGGSSSLFNAILREPREADRHPFFQVHTSIETSPEYPQYGKTIVLLFPKSFAL